MTCSFGPVAVQYDERVLVPRSWTLVQSEWAVELAASARPGPLLEFCAGAGHIGLAAAVLADRGLVQVEKSPVAAGYARRNADLAGMAARVDVREADLEDALGPHELFPVVIADPPYLPTDRVAQWPDDPVLAVDGGPDGLDVVRTCLRVASAHTAVGGSLLLQVGGDPQVDALTELTADGPFTVAGVRRHDPERAVVLLTHSG